MGRYAFFHTSVDFGIMDLETGHAYKPIDGDAVRAQRLGRDMYGNPIFSVTIIAHEKREKDEDN
jgi:hypothetical protein